MLDGISAIKLLLDGVYCHLPQAIKIFLNHTLYDLKSKTALIRD